MTERTDVVVVGAGGGGAVLGLALAQKGLGTIVLEQASGPPGGLRGEILQPNGQQVLARLGLLDKLPSKAVRSVRYFHFCRAGGAHLCTVDYEMLPPPYNRAVVTLPNVAHHVILDTYEQAALGGLRHGTSFKGLRRDGSRVTGVWAEQQGKAVEIEATLVVGADGARSKVREALGIPGTLHLYEDGYLIGLVDQAEALEESLYFVGRGEILGVFPAADRKLYFFLMIPAGSYEAVKAKGLPALCETLTRIAPDLGQTFRNLTDWSQTAYMPTGRVRTPRWVADGALLIGDAAHAMNPHVSQGRMQAMMDAMTVADLAPEWLARGDMSAGTLAEFERRRRPQVTMLQRLADEQVVFWNTGNPVLMLLRDRVFRTLDRNRRLRYAVLEATAGLRAQPPFSVWDRLVAGGFVPDFSKDRV
ncbi:MAG: FAD-dependent monooxygenase [Nitrospirae bacterium]|nr:FAD-dependent monooxygenase [Nitrospirota bacterium]